MRTLITLLWFFAEMALSAYTAERQQSAGSRTGRVSSTAADPPRIHRCVTGGRPSPASIVSCISCRLLEPI